MTRAEQLRAPTVEEIVACWRSGQISEAEMVQICREREDVAFAVGRVL